ncbi:MFS transporter [Pseudonocardia acaciae]|uniref:MFS transporter n=1 Tax=Pseudonocardia acaciae TaxID=551276 RepID=UPI0006887327|nr:MFS transporter [Pseudonocardia acaciae]
MADGRWAWLWRRELDHYPSPRERARYLAVVVLATVMLYYELYVVGGVASLMLADLHMSFLYFVLALAAGNFVGAFGSLFAGFTDRSGRANLVVIGLLVTGLLTLVVFPQVRTGLAWAVVTLVVSFVEGVILVATPALIRDFSPQVGRATAMGFWTMGPVLGSLVVSAVASQTLTSLKTWQSQYVICGAAGLVVFVIALFGLRELSPRLRGQLMVSERDRVLVEARARGLDADQIERSLRHPWRQVLHLDVIASALGVSVMLLIYYTMVAFFTVYVVIMFGFDLAAANALGNWAWGADAVALLVAGYLSDKLRVRKPFMLAGGIGGAVMVVVFGLQAGQHPSFGTLALIVSLLYVTLAFAYASWMAAFTETVEARNPALIGTGLAVWGWLLRLVVTASFLLIPLVVNTVTTLVEDPENAEAHALAAGQWRAWYWICFAGVVVFVLLIFVMKGRWSPRAAARDQAEHDRAVAAELARITS